MCNSTECSSVSSSTIFNKINGLADLYDRKNGSGQELRDGSFRLLDMVSIAKDIRFRRKQCLHVLQSIMHIRWRSEIGLASQVNKRLASRKGVEKTPCNQFSTLREVDALQSINCHRTSKYDDILNNALNYQEKSYSCIQDTNEVECPFRCLIEARVSLLNILNHLLKKF
ncbi:hypothetical protein I3760_05G092100 [Carya illinoinensis]|uniref:Uncharacterized protein n=1 Tax=Carya illinoinensis TaxID=32201 RepID=A0A922EXE2_CARIL|nr:hypothetical protein I3760_05G092100 [Carya illinoinensis]KAG6712099.1 hypothetical protein I3842_05G088500 [Carya illinoinensis]